MPKFERFADVGKGFEHKGDDDPTLPKNAVKEWPSERKGLTPGFANWSEDQLTHELPKVAWLNLDENTIRRLKDKPDIEQMNLGIAGAGHEMSRATEEPLKILHWRIDAEVLRLYNFAAPLEREVLDLFSGIVRRGVPFEQTEYFPKGFSDLERLTDLLAITADWAKTNRRRAKLIDLEEAGQLSPEQASELEHLQRLADARVELLKPRQADAIDEQIEKLKRQGLWTE